MAVKAFNIGTFMCWAGANLSGRRDKKIMGASIYIHLIEWDEFHRRFAEMDLGKAEKGVFHKVFEVSEKEEETSSAVLFALLDVHRLLKAACCESQPKKWPSRAAGQESSSPEVSVCERWLENFEFTFARLMPFWFNPPLYFYRDSNFDFSPLGQTFNIETLSPPTVRAVAQHYPNLEILSQPEYQKVVREPNGFHYDAALKFYLSQWRIIISRAVKDGKGLCIYVI